MKYRKASQDDLKALMAVGKHSYGEFSKVLDGEHWEKMFIFLDNTEQLKRLIEQSQVFVADLEGELVGMVYFVPSGTAEGQYRANWSRIRYLGVHPAHRAKGIGRQLTEMCIELAKVSGEKTVALHTSEFMHTARKMYEDMGFQQTENFQHYGKKYWIYLLRLMED